MHVPDAHLLFAKIFRARAPVVRALAGIDVAAAHLLLERVVRDMDPSGGGVLGGVTIMVVYVPGPVKGHPHVTCT